jgi:hypothetical protein
MDLPQAIGLPASVSACKSQLREESGCDVATVEDACDGNETFHADQAEKCIGQAESASCNQIESGDNFAPACDKVCTVD